MALPKVMNESGIHYNSYEDSSRYDGDYFSTILIDMVDLPMTCFTDQTVCL